MTAKSFMEAVGKSRTKDKVRNAASKSRRRAGTKDKMSSVMKKRGPMKGTV